MNEQDFRSALRRSMAAQSAPPPMTDAPVLAAAHRDRTRRRALLAGTGSAVAVAAIVVGVAVLAPSGGNPQPLGVGGPQVTSTPMPTSGAANAPGTSTSGFPGGMTDRTARSGPRHDRGVALAAELAGVIPPGYASPGDLLGSGDLAGQPLKTDQAQYTDTVNGVELWEYEAIAPVTKGNAVGRVIVEVHTPGNQTTGEGCAMSPAFWAETGTCTEVRVGGKPVAVVTVNSERIGQWAGYRHSDGTVVFIAQSKDYAFAGLPALDGLPFTPEQLAALAADPRFNID